MAFPFTQICLVLLKFACTSWVVAEMSKKLRQLIREKPVDRLLPDTSSFKLDNIISYYMHRCGNWSEGQIAEVYFYYIFAYHFSVKFLSVLFISSAIIISELVVLS